MRARLVACVLLALSASAPAATVTPLFSHDLGGAAGKEGAILRVSLAPGEGSPVHRHDADVFVYVLSGAVVMQVRGGAETTLHAGETFYEAPSDVHVVSRNASSTAPASFIAFFVKAKGAPATTPVR